jgi:hypothetical protein
MVNDLENFAIEKFLSLTPNQCANIMVQNGHFIQNNELVEICEKIVAAGLDQISSQEGGPSIVLEALKGFLLSSYSRSKIIELLAQRVVRDISELSSEEMCEFVALTRNIEDEVASMGGNAEITYTTQVEAILSTVEPYVLEEISLLTVTDLMNAYIGFTHTHVSKPFEITNVLESKLIKLSITKKMSFDDAAEVLFEFSK